MIGFMKQKVKTGHIFCAVLVLCTLVFTACPDPNGPGTKTALAAPRNVQVRENDFTLTWAEVNDAVEYRVDIDSEQAIITRNNYYSLEEKLAAKSGVYKIEVKALAGSSSQFTDSAYSDAIEIEPPEYIFEYDEEEENTQNIRAAQAAAGNLAISGLTNYGKTLNNVVIPVSIGGGTVRSILSNAFAGNTNMASIVIAATITKIEGGAFNNCTALATITFAAPENDETLEIESPPKRES